MSQVYSDFIGELMDQSYSPSGIVKKPNTDNIITRGKYDLEAELQKQADESGADVSEVAKGFAKKNKAKLQNYVATKGEMPSEDIDTLIMQTYNLRANEIAQFADLLSVDPKEAEKYLEEAESKAVEISSPEADSFLGELFSVVEQAAKPALDKANQKRKKKGKKPGVLGYLGEIVNQGLDAGSAAEQGGADAANALNDAKGILGNVYKGLVNQQKKTELKKMLPFIIIGLVVLILVVVLIARKK